MRARREQVRAQREQERAHRREQEWMQRQEQLRARREQERTPRPPWRRTRSKKKRGRRGEGRQDAVLSAAAAAATAVTTAAAAAAAAASIVREPLSIAGHPDSDSDAITSSVAISPSRYLLPLMSTSRCVANSSFLTLAAVAALAQFDKELADREASDYYKEAKTATTLQHCIGKSLANGYGDPELPPPMKEWPKPCLDRKCICGHKRTWCACFCHHLDLALETVNEWPCQDGRVCEGSEKGREKSTVGAHCCKDGDARWLGISLTSMQPFRLRCDKL